MAVTSGVMRPPGLALGEGEGRTAAREMGGKPVGLIHPSRHPCYSTLDADLEKVPAARSNHSPPQMAKWPPGS
jgi:hypothetical protein